MANTVNYSVADTDIDGIENSLKSYLKSQDRFKDWDFEGSNISILTRLLAYNTFTNMFYLNMVGNERFLDSATLRDSIVSHAKELNYTPRSMKSSVAVVDLEIRSSNTEITSILMPKGTSFTGRIGSNSYSFSTDRNIVITGGDGIFQANGVNIFEGVYVSDTFTYSANSEVTYTLSNPNIDTDSLVVSAIENSGANTNSYIRASSLFDLDSTSSVFFLQAERENKYSVLFGDGVIGKMPEDGSVIIANYRVTAGSVPNGCFAFTSDGSIAGIPDVTVKTKSAAYGGSPSETNASIKYNAPRHFQTQERAITPEDYETLLKINFPEINTVAVYGGEEMNPPQYGRVFVSVDLQNIDGLPDIKKTTYTNFLKPRSPLSIDPVFVEPEYMYVQVKSNVSYNINLTTLNEDDIRAFVTASVLNFSDTQLNDFKSTLKYSSLTTMIDNSHFSILDNDTSLFVKKIIKPALSVYQNIEVNYAQALYDGFAKLDSVFPSDKEHTLSSTPFLFNGQVVSLQDDGNGIVRIVYNDVFNSIAILDVGNINYSEGKIQLTNFRVDSYLINNGIDLIVKSKSKNIVSDLNVILQILPEDIEVNVSQVRE